MIATESMSSALVAGLVLLSAVVQVPTRAQAQETFPSRPITLVVPFPPGGMADLSARPLALALEKQIGQPVVVLNRPGASGATGIQYAAGQKPDGYTLMVTLVSFSTIPEVDAIFGRQPAYTRDQFEPIALLAADPPVLVVNASSPWKTLKELVDDAKTKPGTILYSHSGLYGPSHLPMEMFLHAAGIQMRQVPAVGGGPAMTMVLGGNAAMWASPPGMAVPHVEAGKLRVLAAWGAKRHPAFPDVPTLKELGYDVELRVVRRVRAEGCAGADYGDPADCDRSRGESARVRNRHGKNPRADRLSRRRRLQGVHRQGCRDADRGDPQDRDHPRHAVMRWARCTVRSDRPE
jgi:tripartite-type tricarboxylate transporter receptor subunit TctC